MAAEQRRLRACGAGCRPSLLAPHPITMPWDPVRGRARAGHRRSRVNGSHRTLGARSAGRAAETEPWLFVGRASFCRARSAVDRSMSFWRMIVVQGEDGIEQVALSLDILGFIGALGRLLGAHGVLPCPHGRLVVARRRDPALRLCPGRQLCAWSDRKSPSGQPILSPRNWLGRRVRDLGRPGVRLDRRHAAANGGAGAAATAVGSRTPGDAKNMRSRRYSAAPHRPRQVDRTQSRWSARRARRPRTAASSRQCPAARTLRAHSEWSPSGTMIRKPSTLASGWTGVRQRSRPPSDVLEVRTRTGRRPRQPAADGPGSRPSSRCWSAAWVAPPRDGGTRAIAPRAAHPVRNVIGLGAVARPPPAMSPWAPQEAEPTVHGAVPAAPPWATLAACDSRREVAPSPCRPTRKGPRHEARSTARRGGMSGPPVVPGRRPSAIGRLIVTPACSSSRRSSPAPPAPAPGSTSTSIWRHSVRRRPSGS